MKNVKISITLFCILSLLFVLFDKMALERIETPAPETFVAVHPLGHLAQRLGAQADEDLPPALVALDEAGPLEQLEVFGHGVERGVEQEEIGAAVPMPDVGRSAVVARACSNTADCSASDRDPFRWKKLIGRRFHFDFDLAVTLSPPVAS